MRFALVLLVATVLGVSFEARAESPVSAIVDLAGGADLLPDLTLDLSKVNAGGGAVPCLASTCIPGCGSILNGDVAMGVLLGAAAMGGVFGGILISSAFYNPVAGMLVFALGIGVWIAAIVDGYSNGLLSRTLFPDAGSGGGQPRRVIDDRDTAPPPARPVERAAAAGSF